MNFIKGFSRDRTVLISEKENLLLDKAKLNRKIDNIDTKLVGICENLRTIKQKELENQKYLIELDDD